MDDDERQARAIALNRLYEAAPEKGGIGGSLIMQAGFFAGWAAGREYEREHSETVKRLRAALEAVYRLAQLTVGPAELHRWAEEVIGIVEAALWPGTVTDLAASAPKDAPSEPADNAP